MWRTLFSLALMAQVQNLAHGDEPFRLEDAVDAPDWLTLKGEARVRYESLEGQFRAGREGSDQLLLFRTQFCHSGCCTFLFHL